MSLSIIDSAGLLDGDMHQFAQRRFLFALSRFDSRIEDVEVIVTRAIDARQTLQHECLVSIRVRRAEDVSLSETDPDLTKCLSRAAVRTGRAVGLSIERWQIHDRFQSTYANLDTA